MSRVIVFGLDHKSVGEFTAIVNRGYMLYGNPAVSGEQSVSIEVPDAIAAQPWMQFGRLVLIEHPTLEPWAGVLDPPWRALLPVTVTAYSAEYLLSLRTPDTISTVEGSAAAIVTHMVQTANAQEDLFIRIGDTSGSDGKVRQEPIQQRKIWEQLRAFCERTGTELILRANREDDRLYLDLDLGTQIGVDTGELLHDGDEANLVITDAKVVGTLTNRVIGTSTQSTSASRLVTPALLDEDAAGLRRLRSEVIQYRDISEDTTLLRNAQRSLEYGAAPRLQIAGNIVLRSSVLARAIRRGNTFRVHASKVHLPGGVAGWRGSMRLLKYFYNESTNLVNVTMEAAL